VRKTVIMRSSAFLLLALLGFACCEKSWLISTWNGPKQVDKITIPMDTLVREFSVHLIISDVAFITGTQADISRLENMGFKVRVEEYTPGKDLHVLQFTDKLLPAAKQTFASRRTFSEKLVWDLFESKLAVVDTDNLPQDDSPHMNWVPLVESVRISQEPIIPGPKFEDNPLYAHLKKIQFDPTIGFALEDISSQLLYNHVYDLSERYYTRQSASPELIIAQNMIFETFESYGWNVSTYSYRSDYAFNVCADWPGRDNPRNYVIAGAHDDSRAVDANSPVIRAPGAVDNGSGVAGMLEIARVISMHNTAFSNTVRLCVWTGEEQGLLGSDAYAKMMKANNEVVLAYFNADMTGYQLPGTSITLGMKDRSITEWLLDMSYEITATYVPDMPVALSASCCSDYISFWNLGYPSIGYFQNGGAASDYPDYHKETDTVEKNNFVQMRMQTQAIMAAVMTFAAPYPILTK